MISLSSTSYGGSISKRAHASRRRRKQPRRKKKGEEVTRAELHLICVFNVAVPSQFVWQSIPNSQVSIAASVSTLGIADSHNLERIFLQFSHHLGLG
jgi:hypothetical protein